MLVGTAWGSLAPLGCHHFTPFTFSPLDFLRGGSPAPLTAATSFLFLCSHKDFLGGGGSLGLSGTATFPLLHSFFSPPVGLAVRRALRRPLTAPTSFLFSCSISQAVGGWPGALQHPLIAAVLFLFSCRGGCTQGFLAQRDCCCYCSSLSSPVGFSVGSSQAPRLPPPHSFLSLPSISGWAGISPGLSAPPAGTTSLLPVVPQHFTGHLPAPAGPWLRAAGHGAAAALRRLPALPGRPLCGGHLSLLRLPGGARRSVRQMRQAHQRRGAEGEMKGSRRRVGHCCSAHSLLLCWAVSEPCFSGRLLAASCAVAALRCGPPGISSLTSPRWVLPPPGAEGAELPPVLRSLLHAACSWRSGCSRGWRTAGPRGTGRPTPATSRAPGSVMGCGHAASHGTCSGAHLCLWMASGTRWVLPGQGGCQQAARP